MAAHLDGGIQFQVLAQQRPRADKTHLAFDDVNQLRQLVEACGPKELPEFCKPLEIGKLRAVFFGAFDRS